jgi:hypothetical protein
VAQLVVEWVMEPVLKGDVALAAFHPDAETVVMPCKTYSVMAAAHGIFAVCA